MKNRIESLKDLVYSQPSMFEDWNATYDAIEELERLAEIGKAFEEASVGETETSLKIRKVMDIVLDWYRSESQ